MGKPARLRKLARQDKTRPSITFFHEIKGRVIPVKRDSKGVVWHSELYHPAMGELVHNGELKRDELRKTIKFPDMDTAVCYMVTTKLGYTIEKPNFGHWIDTRYWTPLCINPAKQEVKDGQT